MFLLWNSRTKAIRNRSFTVWRKRALVRQVSQNVWEIGVKRNTLPVLIVWPASRVDLNEVSLIAANCSLFRFPLHTLFERFSTGGWESSLNWFIHQVLIYFYIFEVGVKRRHFWARCHRWLLFAVFESRSLHEPLVREHLFQRLSTHY